MPLASAARTLASAAMPLASAAQILDSFFFTHFLDSGLIYFRRAGHRAFGHLSRPHDQ
jgi:hypothetical protein